LFPHISAQAFLLQTLSEVFIIDLDIRLLKIYWRQASMLYELSQKLIQEIERSICAAPPKKGRIAEFFRRELIFPFCLLSKGLFLWLRDLWKFCIIYVLLLILTTWFSLGIKGSEGSELLLNFLFWMSLCIPASLSMFSSPSSFCSYGIKIEQVDAASNFLYKNGINLSSQAKSICEIIKLFEKRIDIRLITFRSLLALIWGFTLYSFNALSQKSISPTLIQQSEYRNLVLLILIFLVLYIATESYAKVNDLIFKTAQFACTEISCYLEQQSNELAVPDNDLKQQLNSSIK
jgi:hypothetical protein